MSQHDPMPCSFCPEDDITASEWVVTYDAAIPCRDWPVEVKAYTCLEHLHVAYRFAAERHHGYGFVPLIIAPATIVRELAEVSA